MTDFQRILAAAAKELATLEFWCVTHAEGDLRQTASKDMTRPVKIACAATGFDWDELVEAGFSLGKCTLTPTEAATLSKDQAFGDLAFLMETH